MNPMTCIEWKQCIAFFVGKALDENQGYILFQWVIFSLFAFIVCAVIWSSPDYWILLFFSHIVLILGITFGFISFIPLVLLGKFLVWRWGEKIE